MLRNCLATVHKVVYDGRSYLSEENTVHRDENKAFFSVCTNSFFNFTFCNREKNNSEFCKHKKHFCSHFSSGWRNNRTTWITIVMKRAMRTQRQCTFSANIFLKFLIKCSGDWKFLFWSEVCRNDRFSYPSVFLRCKA